ncbi:MAG: hypothetical protein ACOYI8_11645 [Christensenellales bacterium]
MEKRELIMYARNEGMSVEEIVRVYRVGRSTVSDELLRVEATVSDACS